MTDSDCEEETLFLGSLGKMHLALEMLPTSPSGAQSLTILMLGGVGI
jgi:hypothetical protein